ncbi:tetratricopeptide repeat protein [Aquabacter sediminis]|uniref:tetratricopeptide repeat protein n=1 Tax=Aquabacter sediminis TaxID=3029197 RepID=UPI00237D7AD5|nr:tetratricopeptide repeat protein [Aquabacter sp. P-9]MDE1569790.1 tetratricopeptide repeat protein [Aquabacter sp. P-9]
MELARTAPQDEQQPAGGAAEGTVAPAETGAAQPLPFARGALDKLRQDVVQMRQRMREDAAARAASAPAPAPAPVPAPAPAAVRQPPQARPKGEVNPWILAERLATELDAVRADLAMLRASDRSEALAGAIDALGRKIDLINAKALDPVALARLERQTGELKLAVSDAVARAGTQSLSAEAVQAAAVEAARAAAREEAARHQPGGDAAALHDRLHALAEHLAALSAEGGLGQLGAQVGLLVERIDSGTLMDTEALSPLVDVIERHMVTLTERVVDTHQRLSRLDHIEDALERLGDEMAHLRHASAQISTEAVQAVALRLSARDDAPALIGLKRSLAALEARQIEFESRTEDLLVRELELGLKELVDVQVVRPDASAGVGAPAQDAAPTPTPTAGPGGEATRSWPIQVSAEKMAPEVMPPDIRSPQAGRLERASSFNLDRRVFEVALGDPMAETHDAPSIDWVAAAERAEVIEAREKPRKRRLSRFALFGRAAMVVAVLAVGGVAVLQILGANPLQAGLAARGQVAANPADAAPPVAAPDLSRLPAAVGPAPLRTAAEAGDADAAYEVGLRYAEGKGVAANQQSAVRWLTFATAKGSVPAAYRLALIQENSLRNLQEAKRLYEWAAVKGNVAAMHALGVLASGGTEGKADWSEAVTWFRKAAELGYRDSQHNLGVIYARGFAGQTDLPEAYKWFTVAAGQGDTDSARKRDEAGARLDPTIAAKAKAAAATFVPASPNRQANSVMPRPEWDGTEDRPSAAS